MTKTHGFILGQPSHIRVSSDGRYVFYLRGSATDPESSLFEYDVGEKKERQLLAPKDLLGETTKTLSAIEKAARERRRIKTRGFTEFQLAHGEDNILVPFMGGIWILTRSSGHVGRLPVEDNAINPRLSPKGKKVAFVQSHNLFVFHLEGSRKSPSGHRKLTGKLVAITEGGTELRPYGLPEFVAQEEMSRHTGFWWAPDGQWIAYQSTDHTKMERFTLADASKPEKAPLIFPYPRPGKTNADVRLFVASTHGHKKKEIRWNKTQYPYLARVRWQPNAPLSLLVQSREQQDQAFLQANIQSGRTTVLLKEHDDAWLNLTRTTPRWLLAGKDYLYATERSGAWQLEQHALSNRSRKPAKVVVDKRVGFRELVHLDEPNNLLWFIGSSDPRESHLLRAPLSGGKAVQITPGKGEHSAVFSQDGQTVVVTRSTLNTMPTSYVLKIRENTAPLLPENLRHVLPSKAGQPTFKPNVELVEQTKGGGFFAAMIRPQDFNAKKKYPVLMYVYGGPGFNTVHRAMNAYFMHQWFADHGFIVVCLDGRGTRHRGRKFERQLKHKFGSVPLGDQVKGLKALGRHYRELDLDRVGVYGWSFGGYLAALAVMKRPDIFKVAVSGAPVTDWHYYDTHYTERYLGLPEESPRSYNQASLITHAKKLKRPLLLIHGIADDNVYFAHTLQLGEALFRHGIKFELLPLVGLTHQVADPNARASLYGRIVNFIGDVLW